MCDLFQITCTNRCERWQGAVFKYGRTEHCYGLRTSMGATLVETYLVMVKVGSNPIPATFTH